MRNHIFFSAILVLLIGALAERAASQIVREPQLLILTPDSTSYDPSLGAQLHLQDSLMRQQGKKQIDALRKTPEYAALSDSQKQRINDIEQSVDRTTLFTSVSGLSQSYLSYAFYERFPNQLLRVVDTSVSGTPEELRKLSESQHLQYILNFPSIRLYVDSGKPVAAATIQLYDGNSGTIVIHKTYYGGWENHGFEFSCHDSTLNCTIMNILSQALPDIAQWITFNSPSVRKDQEVEQERYLLLVKNYFSAPFDGATLASAVPVTDSMIDPALLYQCLYDSSRTRFIAFYSEQLAKGSADPFHKKAKDRSVSIITQDKLTDSSAFYIPETYAYIVDGVQYHNKWYYEKNNVTYFEPKDTLQGKLEFFYSTLSRNEFFKKHTTELNPDFWRTHIFDTIPDRRKDPSWEKYKEGMWKVEEVENRPYIGMWRLVATELKSHRKTFVEEGDSVLYDTIFKPLYNRQHLKLFPASADVGVTMIAPNDRSIFINAVVLQGADTNRILRFFAYLPANHTTYEWTYFPATTLSNRWYPSQIVDLLEPIGGWNYAYTSFDNPDFWENYVLKKEKGQYKYLKKIE